MSQNNVETSFSVTLCSENSKIYLHYTNLSKAHYDVSSETAFGSILLTVWEYKT